MKPPKLVTSDARTSGQAAALSRGHVVATDEQLFEYADCHPRTGMLAAVQAVAA
jgi:hypothetical protein